jgi:hypothetical protein
MRLLFIDTSVEQHTIVINSALSNVVVVQYDSKNAKASEILESIDDSIEYESVAWFTHAQTGPDVSFFGGDPSVAFNSPLVRDFVETFWKPFVAKTKTPIIDFLGCNLLQDSSWLIFLDVLRDETNVIVRASIDNTGSLNKGGDWVLESHDVNVKTIYFTNTIDTWNSTLQTHEGESKIQHSVLDRSFDRFGPFTFGWSSSESVGYVLMNGKVRGPWRRNGIDYHSYGGDPPDTLNSGSPVMRLYSSHVLFIALRVDGSITAWAKKLSDSAGQRTYEYSNEKVVKVWANGAINSSAMCLTENGTLIAFNAWGTFQRGFGSSGSSGSASGGTIDDLYMHKSSDYSLGPFTGTQKVKTVSINTYGFYILLEDGEVIIVGMNVAYTAFAYMFYNYNNYVNGTGTKPPGQTGTLGHGFDSLTTYKNTTGAKPVDIITTWGKGNGCVVFDETDGTQSAICFGMDIGYAQRWVKNFKKALITNDAIILLTTDGQVHAEGTLAGGHPFGVGYQESAYPNGAWAVMSQSSDPVVDIYTTYGGVLAITQSGKVACFGRTDQGGQMPSSGFTVNLSTHRILTLGWAFGIQNKSTTWFEHVVGRNGASLSTNLSNPGKKIVSVTGQDVTGNDVIFVEYEDGEVRYLFSHLSNNFVLYQSSFNQIKPHVGPLSNVMTMPGPGAVYVDLSGYVRAFGYATSGACWHNTSTNAGYLKKWAEEGGQVRSAEDEDTRNIGQSGHSFDLARYQVITDQEGNKYKVWDGTYIDSWDFSGWDLRTFDLSRVYTYDIQLTNAIRSNPVDVGGMIQSSTNETHEISHRSQTVKAQEVRIDLKTAMNASYVAVGGLLARSNNHTGHRIYFQTSTDGITYTPKYLTWTDSNGVKRNTETSDFFTSSYDAPSLTQGVFQIEDNP